MKNKREIWESVELKRISFERPETRRIRKALILATRPFYNSDPKTYEEAYENVGLIQDKPIERALRELYGEVGVSFALQSEKEILKENRKQSDLFQVQMLAYFARFSAEKVTGITDTIKERIRFVLTDYFNSGYNFAEAMQGIVNLGVGYELWRANRIARTEITAASGYGRYVGAKATGLQLNKVWITTFDGRARASHIAADEQRRDIDQPFVVGGSFLNHPGDPEAPASETVNCRCADGYEPKEE